ncbi:MAG: tRNA (adenosine(37)-N6)-threonylcarbamoyltransferase complex ATPase subunit type 1 TsaE [Opitutales bacterium]|nr:tRNA (adenosine(37)-N6)-threonylcarbamoyltransferase complex ATPase subunit type 1 TsaE [Opitutales bacterium]
MSDIFQRLRDGVVCESLEQTYSLAKEFASVISDDCALALSGDLGTGKTAFVKGLAIGLGVKQTVKSPSFNICCVYNITDGKKLVHIDAYRFNDGSQFEDLLIDEIAPEPRVICVEWAEIVKDYFQPDYWLYFDIVNNKHTIKLV